MADSNNGSGGMLFLWTMVILGLTAILASADERGLQKSNQPINLVETANPISTYSHEDMNNLTMLVLCEAGNQSYKTKLAVAAVVLNRVKENFGSTITSVISAPNQFSVYCDGAFYVGGCAVTLDYFDDNQINQARSAINAALVGSDPTRPIGGALFFYSEEGLSEEERQNRMGIQHTMKIGDLVFFRDWN